MTSRLISTTESTITVERIVVTSISQTLAKKIVTLPRVSMHIMALEGK